MNTKRRPTMIDVLVLLGTLGVVAASCLSMGCATDPAIAAERTKAWQSYMANCRPYYETLTIRANSNSVTGMTITIAGASEFITRAPLDPIAPQAQDPTVTGQILGALETIAPWAVMGYVGGQAVGRNAPRPEVVNPVVVDPVIVQP